MPTNIAIGTQENHYMLSVCIITKNEEHNLARCLKSFQNRQRLWRKFIGGTWPAQAIV